MQRMLEVKRFIFGPFETNTYVVSGLGSHILLIDPACSNEWERNLLEKYIEDRRRSLLTEYRPQTEPADRVLILATHGHLDHLWGAKWATERWNMPVLMHEADIPMAQAMQEQYNLFGIRRQPTSFSIQPIENYKFEIINHKFEILSTPGHTPGSVCIYFPEEKILFSGDTLFQMGYGRTDLPGGNFGQLMDSLERLFELPADTRVYPGHGEETMMGREYRPLPG